MAVASSVFLDQAKEVRTSGSTTSYKRFVPESVKKCMTAGTYPVEVESITVSALKLELDYRKKVPRRQCCLLLDGGSIKDGNMRMRIKKCRPRQTVTI
ncbi:hypothetical protein L6164_030765 [Bauhinia variegata]|uniref:Uncharacterized protein n=1 Tax=Bauhinia variegata TaxID=167791 RepID=A0ACB9LD70_BAUVA|nr:hypothetical protein L6164_030765 [Bauhinia variegata]